MPFAKRMAATNQRNSVSIVMIHSGKGVANIYCGQLWIRIWLPLTRRLILCDRTLGVQVDETNGRAAEGFLTFAVDLAWRIFLLLWAWTQIETVCAIARVNA